MKKYVEYEVPERGTEVVVLQHGLVVVQQRGIRAGHDVEVVGRAGVLVVMYQGSNQCCEDLYVCHPVLNPKHHHYF